MSYANTCTPSGITSSAIINNANFNLPTDGIFLVSKTRMQRVELCGIIQQAFFSMELEQAKMFE